MLNQLNHGSETARPETALIQSDSAIHKEKKMQYRCTVCGYIYDEAVEDVPFADLPDDWTCPVCGAPKEAFELCE
jgi:rubredoxin